MFYLQFKNYANKYINFNPRLDLDHILKSHLTRYIPHSCKHPPLPDTLNILAQADRVLNNYAVIRRTRQHYPHYTNYTHPLFMYGLIELSPLIPLIQITPYGRS